MARGFVYSVVSAVCLGTLAILAKMGLAMGFSSVQVVGCRFFFGALMLLAWLAATRPSMLRIRPRALMKAALLGAGIYPVQSWCFIKALETIPASTTSLIYYGYPVATTIIAMVVFRFRPGRTVLLALGLTAVGCGLVFHDAFSRDCDAQGMLYALICMAVFSVYLTLVQVFTRADEARRIAVWVVFSMALVFCFIAPPQHMLSRPLSAWAVALGLGFFPTALAISLLYRAVAEVGSAYVSIFSTIEPVTTVLLSALVLGESLRLMQLAGMALIIAGIVLPNARQARRRGLVERA